MSARPWFQDATTLASATLALVVVSGCSRSPAPGRQEGSPPTQLSGSAPNTAGAGIASGPAAPPATAGGAARDQSVPGEGSVLAGVRQTIASDTTIKSKTIRVSYQDGTVKLEGAVATDDELMRAASDALGVAGVRGVANYLRAEKYQGSPAGPSVAGGDAAIAAVQQKIQSDPNVHGKVAVSFQPPEHRENSGFTADHGTIRLAGTVATEDDFIAVKNDAIKVTDFALVTSINVLDFAQSGSSSSSASPAAPWSEPSDSNQPSIPLCPGLTVATAIASGGDYESIKTVESVDARSVRIKYSSDNSRPWWEIPPAQRNCDAGTPGCVIERVVTHRTVLTADLESGHQYDQIFVTDKNASDTAPGATAIGTSAAVLRELKMKGESDIALCAGAEDTQLKTDDGQLHPVPGGCYAWRTSIRIKRVGNQPVRLRVLLNGNPVDLPAVQARGGGTFGETPRRDEFFFLDDERNPLTLKFRLGIGRVPAHSPWIHQQCELARTRGGFSISGDDPPSCDLPDGGDRDLLRVIKIDTRCQVPTARGDSSGGGGSTDALEAALAKGGKVDIYSIYFSFNSDRLREESQPTLEEIAQVLRRHPDWKLQVNGHTDAIGGDQFNLDLSKRRSAAVKTALLNQFSIGTDRLVTDGYGRSQPRDTNETLEGRARNRRVELMKIS